MEELKALLCQILLDNLQDLVVLEILSGNVQGKILRVNDTSNKAEVLRYELLAIVHDEDSSNIKLDVVFLLLSFEHIERSPLGNKDDRFELESSLNREVLNSKIVFPIVGKSFIERLIILFGDFLWLLHPDWLSFVEFLKLRSNFLDFLLFLVLLFLAYFNTFLCLLFFFSLVI